MFADDLIYHFKLDGFVVLKEVIPDDQIYHIRESVGTTVVEQRKPDSPKGIGHVAGLIRFNQSFAPYLAEPRLLNIIKVMLGNNLNISFTTAIVNEPGNERGPWHSDWPFNQNTAGCIPAPYPDTVMHITTIWMLSEFTIEGGGTLVVPGSHRSNNNPSGNNGIDTLKPYPTETQIVGDAGSVLVFDSRLWHAIALNQTDQSRVAMAVRYAPRWLNLDVLMPGSVERARMMDETGKKENEVPPISSKLYKELPEDVQPLFRHWVRE